MPVSRASSTTRALRLEPTASDVVDLLERYAGADRELVADLDRIGAEAASSLRAGQATVTQLLRLVEDSLVPGLQAKADLDALPKALGRAGIAPRAQQAVDRAQPHPIQGTA